MRVTILHSFYSSTTPSGENEAVITQVEALNRAGHDVDLVARRTDEAGARLVHMAESWVRVASGIDVGGAALPRSEGPEHVLHVHNTFPNFGVLSLLKWDGPLVVTLHNFRPLCSNGLLFREGQQCRECPTHGWTNAVKNRCYRGSRAATLPVALSTRSHSPMRRLLMTAERVVVQSDRSRTEYLAAGIPDERLALVPGFTEDAFSLGEAEPGNGRWVFVGRLSQEKGLADLGKLWPADYPLDVIGDGPERRLLESMYPRWNFMGARPRDWIRSNIGSFSGLVFPGLCAEGAHPMVVREALSRSVPVVALRGSSGADAVADGGGFVYDAGDAQSLLYALDAVMREGAQGRSEARAQFERKFLQTTWLERITEVYREASALYTSRRSEERG